jgi:phospholipid/cholesterol/gamma-HCH transport system ATP-binding protein
MIDIVDVHKSFGGNDVLRGVDLKIERGETFVIIGRSGCGKSVLLKNIVGLLKPDQGQVLVNGKDINVMSDDELSKLRIKVGFLYQGAALFDSLNVGENVGFSLFEHTNMLQEEILEKAVEKLSMVGLKGVETLMPAQLSGGMKKRVGLARAICSDPEVLLYDEPTTGLDPIMSDAINELILNLARHLKVTSVVVTHDMTSAYKIASRIGMLYEGKLIEVGTPDQIKNSKNEVVKQFVNGLATGPIVQDSGAFFDIKNHSMKKVKP